MRDLPFGRPLIGEAEHHAVSRVLSGSILTHGDQVASFEESFAAYTGAPHAVATSSCTHAMHLAYLALGIQPGDEVIVPAQTHVATAHVVEHCQARPVFVDSERITGNLDLEAMAAAVTPRTRAVAVMHYLGTPVNMPRVLDFARRHDLWVLEDCALALGARVADTHVGLHGDAGCFSFYPVKHITTAEGGMMITRHPEVAAKVTQLRAFGIDRNRPEQRDQPGMYDVTMLGHHARMNELSAALGNCQLQRLPVWLERRRANHAFLTERLRALEPVSVLDSAPDGCCSAWYCQIAILDHRLAGRRSEIIARLRQSGVGTSVYYPVPVPLMQFYREKYRYRRESFEVAAGISERSIALPVAPHLEPDDMSYIADSLERAIAASI